MDSVNWSIKRFWKDSFKAVFGSGLKAYVVLVGVIFIFSFLGIANNSATADIYSVDLYMMTGWVEPEIVDEVVDYARGLKVVQMLPDDMAEGFLLPVIRGIAEDNSRILSLLETNRAYVQRNQGEVFVIIIILTVIGSAILFFIKEAFSIGLFRFITERMYHKDTKIKRILAPLSKKRFGHICLVMAIYDFVMLLWTLTIIGGVIKYFEYYFVPYIIAENPDVTWKEAKKMSSDMTRGYKFKMFLMLLTCNLFGVITFIPFVPLFILTPVLSACDAHMYLALRKRQDIDRSLFIEKGYDDPQEEYVLEDFAITGSSFNKADKYKFTDFVAMFFLFCFVGWVWEVALHLVRDHELHNRGFMYGPWLPIYGFGGALIIIFLSRFKGNKPKLFVLTMVLCGILEYITSFLLEFINNSSYWNYDEMFLNLNGRVCLAGLLAFAVGGFVGVYLLGPMIKSFLRKLGQKKTYILCGVLGALFALDLICCLVFGPNSGKGVGQKYDDTNETVIESVQAE